MKRLDRCLLVALVSVLAGCATREFSQSQPRNEAISLPALPPAGLTAIDAHWSNFGSYLKRMIDTVQLQWERHLLGLKAAPLRGRTVSVKFVLNDQGKIAEIKAVEPSMPVGDPAARACISAITDRAPYGAWTGEMKAVLGSQQEMTFTFHYQ